MAALQSSVSAVIVFQRGAAVTRHATALPNAGALTFEGLPLCLDDESVRIELGPEVARLGWCVTDVQVDVDAPEPQDIGEPEDEVALAEASDARDRARARLEATQASIAALREVELERRGSEDLKRRPSHDPTEGRLAWIELRTRSLAGLREALARQRQALEDAEEALRALKDARAAQSSARDPRAFEPRKRVTLRLVSGEDTAEIPIALSYRVPGARWAPSYVLRIEGDAAATLALRAVVAQRTGEDWRGAKLTVSTASWQAWHDLPRLDALRVGRSQPPAARAGWRAPPPDPEGLYADYDRFVGRLEALAVVPMPPADEPAVARRPAPTKKRAPAKPAMAPMPQSTGMMPPAGAMPPPPMPVAMPAAAPEVARASAIGSRARSMKAEASLMMADAHHDDGGGLAFQAPPEPEHGLGRQWFDYSRLRLPQPGDSGRGRLRRQPKMGGSVEQAQRGALHLADDALPDGHAWIHSRPGHAHAYACDAAIDIPSDGQGHVVNVVEAQVRTARNHVCVPGISADVFRTLAARNPLDVPLPAGPLDVYERDTFLLTGSIDATGAGARFEIGLGVEQSIKVARNVEFVEESEGLIKRSNAYAHRIVVDIQNLLPTAASIEIRERIPVAASNEDDIHVTESAAEPPWDVYAPKDDPLEGGRRWQVEVAAGAKTTLRAGYTVRVPGGSQLVGGNRREA